GDVGLDEGTEHDELGEPASERRDAGEAEQEDRHDDGETGGVLEQAAPRGDLGAAGLAGHRHDDGEGAQVHGAVDQEVGDDGPAGAVGVAAHHGEGGQHGPGVGDAGVGEHADDVRLAQSDEVADGHGDGGQHPHERLDDVVP